MRKRRMVDISIFDRVLYSFICIIIVLFVAFLTYGLIALKRHIILSDSSVIAFEGSAWSLLWLIPLLSILSALIIPANLIKSKGLSFRKTQPIKRKKFASNKAAKNNKRIFIITITIVTLLEIVFLVLPFFPRQELLKDGQIVRHSLLNRTSVCASIDTYSIAEFEPYYVHPSIRTSGKWILKLSIETDNRRFRFDYGDFRDFQSLITFLDLLDARGIVRYNGADKLHFVVESDLFTHNEKEKLTSVFYSQ